MRSNFLLGLALLVLPLSAQTDVNRYNPGVTPEGVTYFLPRTDLKIEVEVERTTTYPGDFNAYAERYLRLKNVTKEKGNTWMIKSVKVLSFGVPDTSKCYTIMLKQKTVAPFVSLTKDGLLLSINTETKETPSIDKPQTVLKETFKLDSRKYLTEEILSAGSTTKMAELTATEIYDIRESKSLLAKGQADYMPKDGDQLKLMLKELDEQENALTQLFAGWQEKEKRTFSLTYSPTKNVDKDVLFRLSKQLGIVDSDDLAGAPIYISIKNLETLPSSVPLDPKAKKKAENEVRYMVPSKVLVTIMSSTQEFCNMTIPMAQFGNVETLGGDLFNKKATTKVQFYTETGGIKNIDAEQPK
ncbi:MAG: DUF4831 family protein [Bacteroidaceae bacterium]